MEENQSVVPMGLSVIRKPAEILREAKEAAQALLEVVRLKPKPVIFNGEQYLEFEDWQTCGRFYGLTAKVTWTRLVEVGGAMGYESGADVINNVTGLVVSSAEAMCLNDEEKWNKRSKYEYNQKTKTREKIGEVQVPLFQLRSMAQTRACAKALRNVLSWVVVLAGFKPTVAEELTGGEFQSENPKANVKPPTRKQQSPPPNPSEEQKQNNVFQALRDELHQFIGDKQEELSGLLKKLSSFPGKDGKEIYVSSVDQLENKNSANWAGQILDKLRKMVNGDM